MKLESHDRNINEMQLSGICQNQTEKLYELLVCEVIRTYVEEEYN